MKISEVTKAGYYWAKQDGFGWYNLIIDVHGTYPFFKIRAWNVHKDNLGIIDGDDICDESELIPIEHPD